MTFSTYPSGIPPVGRRALYQPALHIVSHAMDWVRSYILIKRSWSECESLVFRWNSEGRRFRKTRFYSVNIWLISILFLNVILQIQKLLRSAFRSETVMMWPAYLLTSWANNSDGSIYPRGYRLSLFICMYASVISNKHISNSFFMKKKHVRKQQRRTIKELVIFMFMFSFLIYLEQLCNLLKLFIKM